MKLQSENRTGLAKAAAVLASVFTVSLGLCGVNFLAVTGLRSSNIFQPFLAIAGWTELLAIVLSFAGLVLLGFFALILAIYKRFFQNVDRSGDR
ncbi:hypothetical protein [Paracidobacterium acidisoli]|uniref:Uncharacterized protein n=1 Tax=Paracidobacterium acidisoli TaxID=2303751 RepID=A0A372IRB7_9BACT|nr:hypothetical protein [Paracidobacterium acidisoli]MBT9330368.1 hypothetical protein [Paracidobacterium acidisoli]